jgi:hypothetical protein
LRVRILKLLAVAVALAYTVPAAQAGAIRYLAHKIKGGSKQAATATVGTGEAVGKATAGAVAAGVHATKEGAEAVGGGVAALGSATEEGARSGGGAVKKGAAKTAKDAQAAPGAAAHGVKAGAARIWKAIW